MNVEVLTLSSSNDIRFLSPWPIYFYFYFDPQQKLIIKRTLYLFFFRVNATDTRRSEMRLKLNFNFCSRALIYFFEKTFKDRWLPKPFRNYYCIEDLKRLGSNIRVCVFLPLGSNIRVCVLLPLFACIWQKPCYTSIYAHIFYLITFLHIFQPIFLGSFRAFYKFCVPHPSYHDYIQSFPLC